MDIYYIYIYIYKYVYIFIKVLFILYWLEPT